MSKEADELVELLHNAISAQDSIFERDVNSVILGHAKGGQHWSMLSSDIADGLTELGYVKVVRCGECKWWTKVEGENYGWCDELFSLLTADLPYTDKDFYCSQGERKEDTNDAV